MEEQLRGMQVCRCLTHRVGEAGGRWVSGGLKSCNLLMNRTGFYGCWFFFKSSQVDFTIQQFNNSTIPKKNSSQHFDVFAVFGPRLYESRRCHHFVSPQSNLWPTFFVFLFCKKKTKNKNKK